jgi:hypothetical protein
MLRAQDDLENNVSRPDATHFHVQQARPNRADFVAKVFLITPARKIDSRSRVGT